MGPLERFPCKFKGKEDYLFLFQIKNQVIFNEFIEFN